MSEKTFNFVYITTNLINGKQYIGDHSTNNLDDHYLGGGVYLNRSIKKYGKENFKKEILEQFGTKKEAFDAQKKYIDLYNTLKPKGYNISPAGGHQCKDSISDETKIKIKKNTKIALSKKEIIFSEKHKENLKKALTGRKLSPEHKKKCQKANLGKKQSKESGQKKWETRRLNGKGKLTEEHKNKIGDAQRGEKNHMFGKIPWNKGLKMNEDFIEKNRISHIGKNLGKKYKK